MYLAKIKVRLLIAVIAGAACASLAFASAGNDEEDFDVNSAIQKLHVCQLFNNTLTSSDLGTISDFASYMDGSKSTPESLKGAVTYFKPIASSGKLQVGQVEALIASLVNTAPPKAGAADDMDNCTKVPSTLAEDNRVTIIHLVRWGNKGHTTVKFQQWYVYDPQGASSRRFTFTSAQSQFEGTAVAGRTSFRLIYIHLNSDLTAGDESSDAANGNPNNLKHPVNYKITIAKQQIQFIKDLQTVLQILGAVGAAAAGRPPSAEIGYFSVYNFDSAFKTSSITVNASLESSKDANTAQNTSTPTTSTSANAAYSRALTNEGPFPLGLSFAVPLTSYKDATYSTTAGLIQPTTINRQNVYLTLDFYYPRGLPSMTQFRWLPHPFFGMPIKGQPLRNTMVGLGIGLRWIEPFAAIIFDDEQIKAPTGNTTTNHLVFKGAFGIKVPVSTVSKALTSATSAASAAKK